MSTIKILNAAGKYSDPYAREDVISYIMRPDKTPHHIIGGMRVDMLKPAQSMAETAIHYNKDSQIRIRHFVLSFNQEEVSDLALLQAVAEQICAYIAMNYQCVYALHEDTKNPHIHFVFNSISHVDGHRYRGRKDEYYALINFVKHALHSVGIHILIEVKYRPDYTNIHE